MARVPILTHSLLASLALQASSSDKVLLMHSVSKKLSLSLLFTVLYILDTCRLQVTKVTKGALNSSQLKEARDSIILPGLNTCFAGRSILISFTGT